MQLSSEVFENLGADRAPKNRSRRFQRFSKKNLRFSGQNCSLAGQVVLSSGDGEFVSIFVEILLWSKFRAGQKAPDNCSN